MVTLLGAVAPAPRKRRFAAEMGGFADSGGGLHLRRADVLLRRLAAFARASRYAILRCAPGRALGVAVVVCVLVWMFVDADSYVLWWLWWLISGPPVVDRALTHGCSVGPDYAKPFAVVVPLIAVQVSRLRSSMDRWATPAGAPCDERSAMVDGAKPQLVFYFDRPLNETGVAAAAKQISQFTRSAPLASAINACFAGISFTTASLTAQESHNAYTFDIVRNLASTRGSNAQFYAAFKVHSQFRHMFYMEPDTWPLRPGWLSRIDLLTRDPFFWMRGTQMRYEPRLIVAPEPWRSQYTRHINGNAMYELHDPCFARFRDLVREEFTDAAFDVAMAQFRMMRGRYKLERAIAHRFSITDVVADMGVERFSSVDELREKLPGTYLAHAKASYIDLEGAIS
jgi:hypothetical protein